MENLHDLFRDIQGYEAWKHYGKWIDAHSEKIGADVLAHFNYARTIRGNQHLASKCETGASFSRWINTILGNHTILILPTTSSSAPQKRAGFKTVESIRNATQQLTSQKVTALSFELLPRTISRAQTMDVLSSQASVAGYKATLVAADRFERYLPMMITAAGTAKPAKVLVLGTGVAGRMPGHMNVLLADVNVPYDQMKQLDEANSMFENTDVSLVIGANDVTNPLARESGNAISGMPILDVDKSKSVVVIKRSMSTGYAGVQNPLFSEDQTSMLFDDAKKALQDIIASTKQYLD